MGGHMMHKMGFYKNNYHTVCIYYGFCIAFTLFRTYITNATHIHILFNWNWKFNYFILYRMSNMLFYTNSLRLAQWVYLYGFPQCENSEVKHRMYKEDVVQRFITVAAYTHGYFQT